MIEIVQWYVAAATAPRFTDADCGITRDDTDAEVIDSAIVRTYSGAAR